MAGQGVTVTEESVRTGLRIIQIHWVSEADDVTIDVTTEIGGNNYQIIKCVTGPGTKEANDSMGLQLLDRFGIDIFGGKLNVGDFDCSEIEVWIPYLGTDGRANPPILYRADDYDLKINNCGGAADPSEVDGYLWMFLSG